MKDIEDAIPFTLPEGWAWCRLGEIYYHTTGKALKKSNEKGSLKKYITTSNLYWDTFDFSKVRYMYFTDEELDKCTIKKGDLVVCNGGDVGRAAIWNYDHDICYQNHVSRMRPKINGVENRFFLYVLMFYKEQNLLSGKGIGISSLSASDLLSAIVPLPPTNQQRLIVSEIQKIFYQINLLAQNKADLQTAVKQAKSKILDLAIRGKLVPQDPADEPASVMLEKLRAEKEAKIAAGEIKRGKNDSYIYRNPTDNCYYQKYADGCEENISDEIPFDVPDGWAWCRLGEIADIARGGSPRPIEYFITDKENGINWIKIGDTTPEDKYIISAKEKIKPEGRKHSRFVHAGDFLLTNSMSFGRPYILKIDGCIHDGWLVFADIINSLLKEFLYYTLSSQYIYNSFSLVAAGSTVKNLKADTVKQVLFPLPPLAEQKRIVVKIEELFAQLDFITVVPTE